MGWMWLVNEVLQASPAATAGIQPGDIVLKWNGRRVKDFPRLRLLVARTKPGEEVKVLVLRGGEPRSFSVTVDKRPEHVEPMEVPAPKLRKEIVPAPE